MVATDFTTLRDLVLHYAGRRGWRTQRRIAVTCGLDETAFSRFLDGKQDIGAVATFALFQAVRVPIELYPLAFELLGRAQDEARRARDGRDQAHPAAAEFRLRRSAEFRVQPLAAAMRPPAAPSSDSDAPAPASFAVDAAPAPPSPLRRDLAALARGHGIDIGSGGELSTTEVVRLFRAEQFTGDEVATFFGMAMP
jgi:hypothetical protein